jgi:hypothetical protein
MKLVKNFDYFLKNTVNLNYTRIEILEERVETITTFLKKRPTLKKWYQKVVPQGSYKHRTIIKPPTSRNEFDVDVLLFLKRVNNWQPRDYIHNLYANFRQSDLYKGKVSRKSRCVVLDYAGDFHIDIVPCVQENDKVVIMNKDTNAEEQTNPEGYNKWFEDKNSLTEKNSLIKAVRLAKYLRDIKTTFTVKSVLLTTLLGNQVTSSDNKNEYCDVPTTLRTIFNKLDNFLQQNPSMPIISNPSLPSENFNRNWDQVKYSNFRDKIHDYAQKIDNAFLEKDLKKSVKMWQEVFGDDFPMLEQDKTKTTVTAKSPLETLLEQFPAPEEEFLEDKGIKENIKYKIEIDARVSDNRGFPNSLSGSMPILKVKAKMIHFIKKTNIPNNHEYIVKWKIRNTGKEANKNLRGSIEDDFGGKEKLEIAKYVGYHYVECYAIDKNNTCIAKCRKWIEINCK